jgi:hypothetical protein
MNMSVTEFEVPHAALYRRWPGVALPLAREEIPGAGVLLDIPAQAASGGQRTSEPRGRI